MQSKITIVCDKSIQINVISFCKSFVARFFYIVKRRVDTRIAQHLATLHVTSSFIILA